MAFFARFGVLIIFININGIVCQNTCSFRFEAPSQHACEQGGGIPMELQAEIYKTKGNVEGMAEYQNEIFDSFDYQFREVMEINQDTDDKLEDVINSIGQLKQILNVVGQIEDEPEDAQTQLLDTSRQLFAQAIQVVDSKIHNLSQALDQNAIDRQRIYGQMQQTMLTNQQGLAQADVKLKTLSQSVSNLLTPSPLVTTPVGSSLGNTAISKDYFNLLVQFEAVKKITTRNLDGLNRTITRMETEVTSQDGDLTALNATRITNEAKMLQTEKDIKTTSGALSIFDNQLATFENKTTIDIADLKQLYTKADNDLTKVGQKIFDNALSRSKLSADIKSFQQRVDTIVSLLSFTNKIDRNQTTEILNLRLDYRQDLNVLLYAFALRNQTPRKFAVPAVGPYKAQMSSEFDHD